MLFQTLSDLAAAIQPYYFQKSDMKAYIKSGCAISPQHTFGVSTFPESVHESVTDHLSCIEPEYRDLINPLLLRRMPRILKMGLASSQLCIQRAGGMSPDGIIVGTGLGCLDNLEKFLMDVLENHEHVTSVLPFINSTHNAVAAQVSMLLKNQNYNVTYCHRGFSFESALQDAMMHIAEKPSNNILVGGIDESTRDFRLLHSYLNAWKKPVNNLQLLSDKSAGTIAGEGSAFFMLSGESAEEGVFIEGVHTFYTPALSGIREVVTEIDHFLDHLNLQSSDVEGLMLGLNGDTEHDRVFYELLDNYFTTPIALYYKHLCGEYYTSSAFALWLSSVIMSEHKVPPPIVLNKEFQGSLKKILIYNQINNAEHTLILLNYGRF
jgi:3-oxoacyl-(acyl-carrier-protein) synthase